MKSIFVFTAGNKEAQKNLLVSVTNPIDKEKVFSKFPAADLDKLEKLFEEGHGFYAWGTIPKTKTKKTWTAMSVGDYVLCVYGNTYHYVAKILAKYDNEPFARSIWGEDENRQTWQYLYFLTKPIEINLPVKDLEKYLNQGYLGFTRIGNEKIDSIISQFGSLEKFIDQIILQQKQDDPLQEFISIVKRYKEEGTVFRSATQGMRYYIDSVDDSGCVVRRIDAAESERCTSKLYLEKKKFLKESGGSYRFNDFDTTAAKRATFLQALPFGLTADKEFILDLSDEKKALETFIDVLKNLNVDTSSGIPRLYKPAMVACVIEGLNSGEVKNNKIDFDWVTPKFQNKMSELGENVTEDQAALAFFHLTGDMFWLLSYHDPTKPIDHSSAKSSAIRGRVKHALIKDTFWRALQNKSSRADVLNVLKDRWWPDIIGNTKNEHNFWWVNQGDTYTKEMEGNFIWAPQKGKDGRTTFHWQNVKEVKKGDLIFHYMKGFLRAIGIASSDGYESSKPQKLLDESWDEFGWRADVDYCEIASPIPIENIASKIADLKIPYGPINIEGRVNQGYLFKLNRDAANIIISNMNFNELPENIKKILQQLLAKEVAMEKDYSKLLENVRLWIASQGFFFEPWQIAAYITALRTKPFVILAGVSGTGKSKLPALVASATGGVWRLISVRPDWTDSSDVLGYCDLQGKFRPGPLIEFIQDAVQNQDKHYVCIVDEMNLARVEHYFAEVLSRIEDRKPAFKGGYESGPLLIQKLKDEDCTWSKYGLPPNLAIVGTVNMDESAHGFSRKVLDRAFTIELSDIDLSQGATSSSLEISIEKWEVNKWYPRAIMLNGIQTLTSPEDEEIGKIIAILKEINTYLVHAQLQVGYRTRDEIILFALHAKDLKSFFITSSGDSVDPLDLAFHMKILPRIAGGSSPIRQTVLRLLGWAWKGKPFESEEDATPIVNDWNINGRLGILSGARYPRTAARLCLMWDRLQSEGFTSYWL